MKICAHIIASGTEILWRVSLKLEVFFGNIVFPLSSVLSLIFLFFRSAAVSAASTTPALNMCILRRGHGTTAAALQAFPFVTAMNSSASVCMSVCVCAIEPRILQQAVATTVVPGTAVGTQHRAVKLLPVPFFVLCCLRLLFISESNRAPSYLFVGAATAAVPQGRPFVTATNGASVCARMCVSLCAILNTIWAIPTHTFFSEFRKHPRSRQSNSDSTTAANLTEVHTITSNWW